MTGIRRRAVAFGIVSAACAGFGLARAQDFDLTVGNLIAVLRESPGSNQQEEALHPIGPVRAKLADGSEVEIDASWFHYLGDMHVRLVFDGERTMQTASPDDLQRLRLSPQDALQHAVANLRRRYGVPEVEPYSGRLLQVVGGEPDLVSSHFLDRPFWLEVARDYPQGLVVAVPRRTGLLFAAADDEQSLLALRFSATAIYTASERTRVSSALYLFKGGRWSVYQPPLRVAVATGD